MYDAENPPFYPMTHVDLRPLKKSVLQATLNSAGPDNVAALIKNSLVSAPDIFSADLIAELEKTTRNVWQLTGALIAADPTDGAKYVQHLESVGTTQKDIFAVYLTGAARLLGEWCDQSKISFVDVNIATTRIHAILRTIETTQPPPLQPCGKVALFASVPGETHLIGLKMASDIFRRAGWDIDLCIGFTKDDLIDRILKRDHRIIGLSCSGSHAIASLQQLVEDIRIKSPSTKIVLSGQVLMHLQNDVANLAIDGTACDAPEAISVMTKLLDPPEATPIRSGNVIYGAIKYRAFGPSRVSR